MLNRERTKEIFGYDIDPNVRRRTDAEFDSTNKISKRNLKVADNCPSCNVERIISLHASRKNKLCYKCHHNRPEVIAAKQNQNKIKSEETKRKMVESHWSKQGIESAFKGRKHTKSAKRKLSQATKVWYQNASKDEVLRRAIKASCTVRGIEVDNFDGWAVEGQRKERSSPKYKAFEIAVLKRDKNRCIAPGCTVRRKSYLTVHHKDGFHWCVSKRTDVSNGVALCHVHHKEFHDEYGRRENTEQQFEEWMAKLHSTYNAPVRLIIIAGPSGSGKSWVSNQLAKQCSYVRYDRTPREQHILKIMVAARSEHNKPVIYDPFRKAGTIYERYKDVWPCLLVVIDEPEDVIVNRIKGRGGEPKLAEIKEAISKNKRLSRKAHFSGSSDQVLSYITDLSNKDWDGAFITAKDKSAVLPAPTPTIKPVVYLVSGVSGAGKSWVCSQLTDKYAYVSYDANSKAKHVDLLKAQSDMPKLYDPPIKISTFIRRHSDVFDIVPVFIIEDEATIRARLTQRGGIFTEGAKKRMEAISSRNKKYGVFSGTSAEVLAYMQGLQP